ncbi:MAG: hypothetical protein JO097_08805, partial [Acidobacteriaceae bacterium]|nr:hypothetical protein [Acidobacteriaceae bacterium]
MKFRPVVLTVLGCVLAVSAIAQTAQLSGIITDPSGKGIPDADIQIRNQE